MVQAASEEEEEEAAAAAAAFIGDAVRISGPSSVMRRVCSACV